jgi:hypothetical protein
MEPTTPPKSPKRAEYNTITRTRFFDTFDNKESTTSLRQITLQPDINVPPSTARRWLSLREKIGSPAHRQTRKRLSILGRKSLVSASVLETVTNQDDPIHNKSYEDQVKELNLPYQPSTLQYTANQAGAKRFKKGYTSEISEKNRRERVDYGHHHKAKTLTNF